MKIWNEFNSSHSNNITIIGEFREVENLNEAYDMIEDFALAGWEERYPSIEEFKQHWSAHFHPDVKYAEIFEQDYHIGMQHGPDIGKDDNSIVISKISGSNIGGLVKLLHFAGANKITVNKGTD